MARVLKREAAKRDLTGHFAYLAENASLEVARRFGDAARSTFGELSDTPEMGAPGKVRHGKYADVRLWRVGGFERYLIAYRPLKDGVVIERVFHAAQDYGRVLK
jgi:plasmid stabilization system protein ParE